MKYLWNSWTFPVIIEVLINIKVLKLKSISNLNCLVNLVLCIKATDSSQWQFSICTDIFKPLTIFNSSPSFLSLESFAFGPVSIVEGIIQRSIFGHHVEIVGRFHQNRYCHWYRTYTIMISGSTNLTVFFKARHKKFTEIENIFEWLLYVPSVSVWAF